MSLEFDENIVYFVTTDKNNDRLEVLEFVNFVLYFLNHLRSSLQIRLRILDHLNNISITTILSLRWTLKGFINKEYNCRTNLLHDMVCIVINNLLYQRVHLKFYIYSILRISSDILHEPCQITNLKLNGQKTSISKSYISVHILWYDSAHKSLGLKFQSVASILTQWFRL